MFIFFILTDVAQARFIPFCLRHHDGRYTPEQALAKLLGASGISYRFADGQVIALAQAPKPNPPANPAPVQSVQLGKVTVKADSLGPDDISPYMRSESTAGSKVPVETTRIPQSIQVITGEALRDQGALSIGNHGTSELGSFAFQDIISITPEFDLTGGVRQSTYSAKRLNIANGVTSEIDTDNTSYQVGGTFHATDSIHFFAGYGEGFSPLPAIAMANGAPLEPGESAQVEAGVKINSPSGLSGTASFFDITRSNVTTPDRFNPGFQVATGEIQSRGAEVELAYQVNEQWYIQGGYAFIDAEITQSNANDVGNRPEKIPEHQANIWTHYRFDSGVLKNLTLSAGANYVGNRPFDNANTAVLPNYTTLDLASSYTWKNVKLELFANNVLDKRYFVSADFGPAVFPGDPRTIFGRVSLKF